MIESEKVLTVSGELLMSISRNERERAIFRSRRKLQTDYESDMAISLDNGISIGRKNREIEIAQNAIHMNLPISDIAKLTGLSCEEIERLREEEACKESEIKKEAEHATGYIRFFRLRYLPYGTGKVFPYFFPYRRNVEW